MSRRQAGFTLIEMILVMALLVPVLYGIVSAPGVISGSVHANRGEASIGLKCRMHAERIASLLRPSSVGSLQMQDMGVWTPMLDDIWCSGLQFQKVRGVPTPNSLPLTAPSTIEFALAPGEAAFAVNGKDDDRDGVVDNGFVRLTSGSTVSRLTGRVERFRVRKSGRTLQIELAVAERDPATMKLHRRACMIDVLLENN